MKKEIIEIMTADCFSNVTTDLSLTSISIQKQDLRMLNDFAGMKFRNYFDISNVITPLSQRGLH